MSHEVDPLSYGSRTGRENRRYCIQERASSRSDRRISFGSADRASFSRHLRGYPGDGQMPLCSRCGYSAKRRGISRFSRHNPPLCACRCRGERLDSSLFDPDRRRSRCRCDLCRSWTARKPSALSARRSACLARRADRRAGASASRMRSAERRSVRACRKYQLAVYHRTSARSADARQGKRDRFDNAA